MSANQQCWGRSEQIWAGTVALGIVGAALWPLRQYRRPPEQRSDGFPMSYYPMFSQKRGQYGQVAYAVGVRADGVRENLRYKVLGAGGVNQVRRQIERARIRGRIQIHAELLAERIAGRADCAQFVRVEIVLGEFDYDACLLDGEVRGSQTLLAQAEVHRPVAALSASTDRLGAGGRR